MICYDITEQRIRVKVVRLLLQHRYERLQKSVFVGDQPPVRNDLWASLERLITSDTDQMVSIKIGSKALLRMRNIGNLRVDVEFICGLKSSLFI